MSKRERQGTYRNKIEIRLLWKHQLKLFREICVVAFNFLQMFLQRFNLD